MSNNYKFQPLRIRAYLQSGVVSSETQLPLDSIVFAQYVRDAVGERYYTLPNEIAVPDNLGINLPFRKNITSSKHWFYACSFAQWPEHIAEGMEAYTKKFDMNRSDLIDFGKKKANVDISRGKHKAYHNKLYYRHALYVEWYALGDKQAIEDVLRFCTHIGKKTSQGWGAVLRWEVIEWKEDWSVRGPITKGNKRRLMRAVPAINSRQIFGIRPSYWSPKNQCHCLVPDGKGGVIC